MSDISTPPDAAEPGTEVHSHFVRERNVMMVEVAMGELYVDYYLHLAAQGIKPAEAHDALFKRALAAFVLHTAAQPWNVMTAWTINFQKPLVNLFLTGDNETGAVTGRVFADHVRELPQNLFYGDVVRGKAPTRRSSIAFTGSDPIVAVEEFYGQSEQRVGRFFEVGEERWGVVDRTPGLRRGVVAGVDARRRARVAGEGGGRAAGAADPAVALRVQPAADDAGGGAGVSQ